jgi:phosphotransferase system enzyme I (PtsI)
MNDINKIFKLQGIAVSPGIVIGEAYLLDRRRVKHIEKVVKSSNVDYEVKRFLKSVENSKKQLLEIKEKVSKSKGKSVSQGHLYIIDIHLMFLEDKMLIDDTINKIKEKEINAEWALRLVVSKLQKVFENLEDDYFRERKSDVVHIGERILRNLVGRESENIIDIDEDIIMVAHDLSPADTAQMSLSKGKVKGFLTDVGSKTSHTAIMARSLKIPAIVGLERITQVINAGDMLIIDGITGIVLINPDDATIKEYKVKKKDYDEYEKQLISYKKLPAVTKDGRRVSLTANIELLEEIPTTLEYGAEGIGLYRTEFLYMNRKDMPGEDEHFETYKKLVEEMSPNPITIRTLDLGGDKFLSQLDLAEEMNPAMGLRAIRFCLKEKDIFKTQLRAILRASHYGEVKIMFPMISGIPEIREAKGILEEAKMSLNKDNIPFDENVQIGIMIEIPSAVTIADLLAKEVGFFSIGTNDLIQYSLAIDRVNEHVAYLYEPLHPALLRTIKHIVDVGHSAGIKVSICGEMAGEQEYILILLALGLDQLSMNSTSIPRIKKILRSTNYHEANDLLKKCLKMSTAYEIEKFVRQEMHTRFPDDFR